MTLTGVLTTWANVVFSVIAVDDIDTLVVDVSGQRSRNVIGLLSVKP